MTTRKMENTNKNISTEIGNTSIEAFPSVTTPNTDENSGTVGIGSKLRSNGRDPSTQHIVSVGNDSEKLGRRFGAKRTYIDGKSPSVQNNYICRENMASKTFTDGCFRY